MKYTNYFSAKIGSDGIPHLDVKQFKVMMNIVFLEGKIDGIKYKAGKSTDELKPEKDIDVYDFQERLKILTNGIAPQALLNKLVVLSGN
jgi:hypothetical protein